jgi:hypothetical protein
MDRQDNNNAGGATSQSNVDNSHQQPRYERNTANPPTVNRLEPSATTGNVHKKSSHERPTTNRDSLFKKYNSHQQPRDEQNTANSPTVNHLEPNASTGNGNNKSSHERPTTSRDSLFKQ